MSAFSASSYRRASMYGKTYTCVSCRGPIGRGHEYLRYELGLMNNVKICLKCSVSLTREDARLRYHCRAVEERIAALGARAGEQAFEEPA